LISLLDDTAAAQSQLASSLAEDSTYQIMFWSVEPRAPAGAPSGHFSQHFDKIEVRLSLV
jgi:hypothetical protein